MNPNVASIRAQDARGPVRLAFWFVVLTLLGTWPALTNRQPFFFADTSAYVRGADLAIAKLLGDNFATNWAKDPRRTLGIESSVADTGQSAQEQKPPQRIVLAGRSIVYGALLYLGAITGGMWFPIIVQSMAAVYLVFLFVVRTLRLDYRHFLVSCGVLFVLSPLPFCVSFLMPDVFAGFLILGFAILAVGWDRLNNFERTFTSGILLFAVLFHASHLILLISLAVLSAAYSLWIDRSRWIYVRNLGGIAVACVVLASLWETAFSVEVTRALGTPPVRPPFVTARLVAMLGEPAVSRVCASGQFTVCRFQDRFPIDSDTFLWSEDKNTGVFNIADIQTKHALDQEQMHFAMAIIPPNFGRFLSGVTADSLRQLVFIGLDEYWYSDQGLAFFQARLPSRDFERMSSTLAARSRAYILFGRIVLYLSAALSVVVILALLSGAVRPAGFPSGGSIEQARSWRSATYILLVGILLNAAICGGLSAVNNRYETRVIWLVQLSMTTGILILWPQSKAASLFTRSVEQNVEALRH